MLLKLQAKYLDLDPYAAVRFITQPSIYGVMVYFLPSHESLNYCKGEELWILTGTI